MKPVDQQSRNEPKDKVQTAAENILINNKRHKTADTHQRKEKTPTKILTN
jgi:hypothetical protein